MTLFYDVLAMGLALAVAIALFAALFVVPLVVVWLVARGFGGAWRWSAARSGGALERHGHRLRLPHALGATVRSRRT
jgi:hypothetical protein